MASTSLIKFMEEQPDMYYVALSDLKAEAIYKKLLDLFKAGDNEDYNAMIKLVFDNVVGGEERSSEYLQKVYDHFMSCTDGQFPYYAKDHSLCETVVKNYMVYLEAYIRKNELPQPDLGRAALFMVKRLGLDKMPE